MGWGAGFRGVESPEPSAQGVCLPADTRSLGGRDISYVSTAHPAASSIQCCVGHESMLMGTNEAGERLKGARCVFATVLCCVHLLASLVPSGGGVCGAISVYSSSAAISSVNTVTSCMLAGGRDLVTVSNKCSALRLRTPVYISSDAQIALHIALHITSTAERFTCDLLHAFLHVCLTP